MGGQHCENYDVKRRTLHSYPRNTDRCCEWSERAVEGGLMLSLESQRVFQNYLLFLSLLKMVGLMHLLCYITNLRHGKHWDSRQTKFTSPLWAPVIKSYLHNLNDPMKVTFQHRRAAEYMLQTPFLCFFSSLFFIYQFTTIFLFLKNLP